MTIEPVIFLCILPPSVPPFFVLRPPKSSTQLSEVKGQLVAVLLLPVTKHGSPSNMKKSFLIHQFYDTLPMLLCLSGNDHDIFSETPRGGAEFQI